MVQWISKAKCLFPPSTFLTKWGHGRGDGVLQSSKVSLMSTSHQKNLLCFQKGKVPVSKSFKLGGDQFEPLHYFGLLLIGKITKREGVAFPPFSSRGAHRPFSQKTPVGEAPKVKYEGTAKHTTRSEAWGRPDSSHLSSSHSNWAQLQESFQLQTKCGLKKYSQVLWWDRQQLPSRDGKC